MAKTGGRERGLQKARRRRSGASGGASSWKEKNARCRKCKLPECTRHRDHNPAWGGCHARTVAPSSACVPPRRIRFAFAARPLINRAAASCSTMYTPSTTPYPPDRSLTAPRTGGINEYAIWPSAVDGHRTRARGAAERNNPSTTPTPPTGSARPRARRRPSHGAGSESTTWVRRRAPEFCDGHLIGFGESNTG